MTQGVQRGLVVLIAIAAQGLAGCGPEPSVPSSPSPLASSQPPPPRPELTAVQQLPPGTVFDSNVTLSGFVFEIAQDAELPIEGAWVYCEPCGEETHSGVYTDNKGLYSFKGIWGKVFSIRVTKDDYQDPPGTTNSGFPNGPGWRDVIINGDTRFNVQLARK